MDPVASGHSERKEKLRLGADKAPFFFIHAFIEVHIAGCGAGLAVLGGGFGDFGVDNDDVGGVGAGVCRVGQVRKDLNAGGMRTISIMSKAEKATV